MLPPTNYLDQSYFRSLTGLIKILNPSTTYEKLILRNLESQQYIL